MSAPDLFTVTEAAVVLRIGRTTAYELARRDLATGGGEGLGVVRIGGQLRIPRVALERIIGGPVTTPTSSDDERVERFPTPPTQHAVAAVPGPTRADPASATPARRVRLVSVGQLRFEP